MLPSLRPLIAESMRDLAMSDHGVQEWQSAIRGARTLEWCDANDPDNAPDPSEVEMLDQIEAIVTDSKTKIAAQIREVLGL